MRELQGDKTSKGIPGGHQKDDNDDKGRKKGSGDSLKKGTGDSLKKGSDDPVKKGSGDRMKVVANH
jgi:hypothetical protein